MTPRLLADCVPKRELSSSVASMPSLPANRAKNRPLFRRPGQYQGTGIQSGRACLQDAILDWFSLARRPSLEPQISRHPNRTICRDH